MAEVKVIPSDLDAAREVEDRLLDELARQGYGEAATFARTVVAGCGPLGRDRAKNLLWAAGKLADYGLGLGLEPVPEVLLHPSVMERFTRCAPGLSDVARRTLRTNLRFIGRRVVPQLYPADVPLPRERAKEPYSPAEIAGYLALADAQPTPARRMRAAGLICLGAGAGHRHRHQPCDGLGPDRGGDHDGGHRLGGHGQPGAAL